jgi:uncharacterized protein
MVFFFRAILVLLLLYCIICAFLFFTQGNAIYFPDLTKVSASSTNFSVRRGAFVLRGWSANENKEKALIYFGGNAERIELNMKTFQIAFPNHSIYLLAYRGYGASDGRPKQNVLFEDALAFFDQVALNHKSGYRCSDPRRGQSRKQKFSSHHALRKYGRCCFCTFSMASNSIFAFRTI